MMSTKKESEKRILYCLEELRLLIEKPYENDALVERLSIIENKLELLYHQTFYRREENLTMSNKIRDLTLYSVPELSQKMNVTTVTIRNYLKQGKLKGKKVMGKWFILDENVVEFFKDSTERSGYKRSSN